MNHGSMKWNDMLRTDDRTQLNTGLQTGGLFIDLHDLIM